MYCAPEQMQGEAVDHRADIFSLGVMFYEMLTGQLPQGSWTPPSAKVQVDYRIDEVIVRAMAQEPDHRYQHASQVRTDVDTIRTTKAPAAAEPTSDSPKSAKRKGWALWGLGIGVTFIAVWAILITLVWNPRDGDPPAAPTRDPQRSATSSSRSRLPSPTLPLQRPTEECRIVVLPLDPSSGAAPPEFVKQIAAEDEDDVVMLDRCWTPFVDGERHMLVFGVRADGSVSAPAEMKEKVRGVKDSVGYYSFRKEFYLNRSGEILPLKGNSHSFDGKHGKYVKLGNAGSSVIVGLTENGEIEVVGEDPRAPGDLRKLLECIEDAVDFRTEALAGNVLRRDGSILGWGWKSEEGQRKRLESWSLPPETVVRLGASERIGFDEDGQIRNLQSWLSFPSEIQNHSQRWNYGRIDFYDQGPGLIAVSESGDVVICPKLVDGPERAPELERALHGLVDVQLHADGFIFALLPKDTVPRAGFWTAEGLIEARQQLLGAENDSLPEPSIFPLPKPEFPPTRPSLKCRAILLPFHPHSIEPRWFDRVREDDIVDIVKLSAGADSDGWAVIRDTGELHVWPAPGNSHLARLKSEASKFTDVVQAVSITGSNY
ncbi:MAG: hypothetical protein AAF585_28465, partial [Verrucomicrobiota bacterium]